MSSPGPTFTMPARKVRMGDVLFLPNATDDPRAVVGVEWVGNTVQLSLDDGTAVTADVDDQLDVSRPFARHAETGEHDR